MKQSRIGNLKFHIHIFSGMAKTVKAKNKASTLYLIYNSNKMSHSIECQMGVPSAV